MDPNIYENAPLLPSRYPSGTGKVRVLPPCDTGKEVTKFY